MTSVKKKCLILSCKQCRNEISKILELTHSPEVVNLNVMDDAAAIPKGLCFQATENMILNGLYGFVSLNKGDFIIHPHDLINTEFQGDFGCCGLQGTIENTYCMHIEISYKILHKIGISVTECSSAHYTRIFHEYVTWEEVEFTA